MGKSVTAGEGRAGLVAECMHTHGLRLSIKLGIISIALFNLWPIKVQTQALEDSSNARYLQAVCELQYCCRIQEGSILYRCRCVLHLMLRKAAGLWKNETLKVRCSFHQFCLFILCSKLWQKKQSYSKCFDSIGFDFTVLLQTCTLNKQLLELQRDLKSFSQCLVLCFANKKPPNVSWDAVGFNLVVRMWTPDLELELRLKYLLSSYTG